MVEQDRAYGHGPETLYVRTEPFLRRLLLGFGHRSVGASDGLSGATLRPKALWTARTYEAAPPMMLKPARPGLALGGARPHPCPLCRSLFRRHQDGPDCRPEHIGRDATRKDTVERTQPTAADREDRLLLVPPGGYQRHSGRTFVSISLVPVRRCVIAAACSARPFEVLLSGPMLPTVWVKEIGLAFGGH